MTKNKKNNTQSGANINKDFQEELISAPLNEEKWTINIQIIVENQINDAEYIKVLANSVNTPLRRKFSMLRYEDLLEKVDEFGNVKNRKLQTEKRPRFCGICEQIYTQMNSNQEVSLHLWAKLIKFGLLMIKDTYSAKASNVSKQNSSKANEGKKQSNKSAGGGKKTKKNPDTPKTQKKEGTTLKRRSETDLLNNYIDDEPVDGPSHYVLISGFRQLQILPILENIGVFVNGIVRIQSESYEELESLTDLKAKPTIMQLQESQLSTEEILQIKKTNEKIVRSLELYWRLLPHVLQYFSDTSKTQDIIVSTFEIPTNILPMDWHNYNKMNDFGAKVFDLLAFKIYDSVKLMRQYLTYMNNLEIINLPNYPDLYSQSQRKSSADTDVAPEPVAGKRKSGDYTNNAPEESSLRSIEAKSMRYYSSLMDNIPMESVSVPLILHCMLEQVVATEAGKISPSKVEKSIEENGISSKLAEHICDSLQTVNFTKDERNELAKQFPNINSLSLKTKNEKRDLPVVFHYHNDIAARTHNLTDLIDLNPMNIEEQMLDYSIGSKLTSSCNFNDESYHKRVARLHELIQNTSTTTFSTYQEENETECNEIVISSLMADRAFRQFVFESMSTQSTDNKQSEDLTSENFWDDPYDFIIRTVTNAANHLELNKSDKSGRTDHSITELFTGKKLNAKHPSDSDTSQDECEQREQNAAMLYKAITTHKHLSPKRFFDDFVYTEELDRKVLLQVLKKARDFYPCMDTYHHKRDNCLLVFFHHPISDQLDAKFKWFKSLHSNVGFRNFVEYVAPYIEEWSAEQEQIYKENKKQEEFTKMMEQNMIENIRPITPPNEKKKSKKRSKSPKTPKKGGKTSRPESKNKSREEKNKEELVIHSNSNPFILPGSLKNQDKNKSEETQEELEGRKEQNQSTERNKKSGKKTLEEKVDRKGRKEKKGSVSKSRKTSKDSRDSSTSSRKSSSSIKTRRSSSKKSQISSQDTTISPTPEPVLTIPKHPFVGYDVGNKLLHLHGNETFLYPSDGGIISIQNFSYILGQNYIRVKICKDDHEIIAHVIEPKDHVEDEKLEKLLDESEKFTETQSDSKEVPDLDRQHDRKSSDCPPSKSDYYSEFGSTTCRLSDGMMMSYSSHGDAGICSSALKTKQKIKKLLKNQLVTAPSPPVPVERAPSALNRRSSSGRSPRQKSSPRGKSPKVTKMRKQDSVKMEPEADSGNESRTQTDVEKQPNEETNSSEQGENCKNPNLFISCPDGLSLCFDYNPKGKINHEKRVFEYDMFVRQYYPIKVMNKQTGSKTQGSPAAEETSRTVMSDGTVIKVMPDGSTQVLCLDGSVHSNQGSSALFNEGLTMPRNECSTHPNHNHIVATAPPSTLIDRRKTKNRKSINKPGLESTNDHGNLNNDLNRQNTEIDLSSSWKTTLISGEVYYLKSNGCKYLHQKKICYKATDPVTKEIYLSLEDHVIRVQRPDGGIVCEHEDGTRITKYSAQDNNGQVVWFVSVECSGFATVTFNQSNKESVTTFGSGSRLLASCDGSYKLLHWSGGEVMLDQNGSTTYIPVDEGVRRLQNLSEGLMEDSFDNKLNYILRHNSSICCEVCDLDGNLFQVTNKGVVNTISGHQACNEEEEESDARSSYRQKFFNHPPRLFIIKKDGTGSELLRENEIKDYIHQSEIDALTAVVRETLFSNNEATAVTVMRPRHQYVGDGWKVLKQEANIIPPNIRSRDLLLVDTQNFPEKKIIDHQKLENNLCKTDRQLQMDQYVPKCPDVIEVRQLLRYKEVSKAIREHLKSKFISFVRDLGMEEIHRQTLKVLDPRSIDEVLRANDLLSLVLEYDDVLTNYQNKSVDNNKENVVDKKVCEQLIIPTLVFPENKTCFEQASLIKSKYENIIQPKKEKSSPKKAKPKLTEENWQVIRNEILDEELTRKTLKERVVPPYFASKQGRAWLIQNTNKLNEASFLMHNLHKCLVKSPISIELTKQDNKVYVGKRPIDKVQVGFINDLHQQSTESMYKDFEVINHIDVNEENPSFFNKDQDKEQCELLHEKSSKSPGVFGGFLRQIETSFEDSISRDETKQVDTATENIKTENENDAEETSQCEEDSSELDIMDLKDTNQSVKSATCTTTSSHSDISNNLSDVATSLDCDQITKNLKTKVATKRTDNSEEDSVNSKTKLFMASLMATKPDAIPNKKYIEIEEPVRRQTKTSSITGGLEKGFVQVLKRGFEIHPNKVSFGILKEGEKYSFKAKLKNVGIDSCRYRIESPPPSTGIFVHFAPRQVAAGMSVVVKIEVYAIAIGVVGDYGVGRIDYQLKIISESDILYLPIVATVLTSYEYDRIYPEECRQQLAPGVIKLNDKKVKKLRSKEDGDLV